MAKSGKFGFNFEQEEPIFDPENEFEWQRIARFSKSETLVHHHRQRNDSAEVALPKNLLNFLPDRKSTANTTINSIL